MLKLLVILPRVPYPLDKGDKLRAYYQLQQLAKHFEIHLCCLNDLGAVSGAEETLLRFCSSVHIIPLTRAGIFWNVLKALFSGEPLQAGYFYSCRAKRQIHGIIREIRPDHIYCQLLRVAKYVKNIDIKKTLDFQDVFSTGYERQASMAGFPARPLLRMEAARLKRYETRIFDWFDHHTIISEPDREQIAHPQKHRIAIIHNGVDFDYFHPVEREKDVDILFTGNMNYPPNVTGVEFLVKKILPELSSREVRVMIAGVSPSRHVLALGSAQVEVTGRLEDIREAYARAKMFVAPMQIGTGMQNKLLEAMAMKIPCITSPLANAALGAEPGKGILVCSTPAEYARAIYLVLNNESVASQIADNAFVFVNRNYRWDVETEKLCGLIQSGCAL